MLILPIDSRNTDATLSDVSPFIWQSGARSPPFQNEETLKAGKVALYGYKPFCSRRGTSISLPRRAKYSECPSRILMRRRKNLLRHRMRGNGGNTYKSREKGAHCRRLMACLGRRVVATCTRTTRAGLHLSGGLGVQRGPCTSAEF